MLWVRHISRFFRGVDGSDYLLLSLIEQHVKCYNFKRLEHDKVSLKLIKEMEPRPIDPTVNIH